MTIDEVALFLTLNRFLCLALKIDEDFPGYVRSVFLRDGNQVVVEFEQFGFDEGGAYFYAEYPSLTDAVTDLEDFLHFSVTEWRPLSESVDYPAVSGLLEVTEGTRKLAAAIANQTVPLPKRAVYELRGSSYWLHNKPS